MPIVLQVFIVVICLFFFVYIVSLVVRKKLLLKYSLLWLALSLVVGICALFPGPLYFLASILGFETASNFIFVLAVFFLLAICLSLSVIASRQTAYIKSLIQELALLKHDEENSSNRHSDVSSSSGRQ